MWFLRLLCNASNNISLAKHQLSISPFLSLQPITLNTSVLSATDIRQKESSLENFPFLKMHCFIKLTSNITNGYNASQIGHFKRLLFQIINPGNLLLVCGNKYDNGSWPLKD